MSIYERKKWEAIAEAQAFQIELAMHNLDYLKLTEKQAYFEKLGKRYGLIKEFKENGII